MKLGTLFVISSSMSREVLLQIASMATSVTVALALNIEKSHLDTVVDIASTIAKGVLDGYGRVMCSNHEWMLLWQGKGSVISQEASVGTSFAAHEMG